MKTFTQEEISEIAQELEAGLKCFWNIHSGELVFVPDELQGFDIYDLDEDESWEKEFAKLKQFPDDFKEIEKPGSFDSFKFMTDFARTLIDQKDLQHILFKILEEKKPFRNFNDAIHHSEARENWFEFRNMKLRKWVELQIRSIKKEYLDDVIEIKETKDPDLLSTLNEEIQTIHHQLYPEIFKPYDQAAVKPFFEALVNDENCKTFVAFQDGIPVGYVLMMVRDFKENPFQYARKYVELDQISVLEKNQGIGQMLVDKVVEEAEMLGIDRIELNHWTTNAAARQFFKRNGFEYASERMFLNL